MRTEYKDCDDGEQLRVCLETGVWNEGKMSPGGREMTTSGGEREERRAWTPDTKLLLALFHCMVWHGTVRFTFGGFSTGYCTWYLILF